MGTYLHTDSQTKSRMNSANHLLDQNQIESTYALFVIFFIATLIAKIGKEHNYVNYFFGCEFTANQTQI